MGVVEVGSVTVEIVAPNAPRERNRFQKVQVPGLMTRGRWRCWDFPDENPPPELKYSMISFSDTAKHIMHSGADNTPTSRPNMMNMSHVTPNAPNPEGESSTIVVTSIRPQPMTPSQPYSPISDDMDSQPSRKNGLIVENPTFEIIRQVVPSEPEIAPPQMSVQRSEPSTMISNISHTHSRSVDNSPGDDDSSSTTINVVAIDNKIEQAMDLVKTHLTFAVREEVEVLRNTIIELESRVVHLEAQNAVLRQYVPKDVLTNMAFLIHQQAKLSAEEKRSVCSNASTME